MLEFRRLNPGFWASQASVQCELSSDPAPQAFVVGWWGLVLQRSVVEFGAFLLGEEVGGVHGIVVGELDWWFPLVDTVLVVTVLEPLPEDVVEQVNISPLILSRILINSRLILPVRIGVQLWVGCLTQN